MARKLRVEYTGAIYHVMSRGDRRAAIFKDDKDRQCFVATLAGACEKTGWRVHAYCLMANHFHLVVETPRGNLVAGMKWFLGTYTGRFNRRHKLFGHLFSGRYKALIVDGSGSGYLKTVCEYVHLNPVRAKLLSPEEPLRRYRWSSWPEYLKRPRQRPGWLHVARLLGELGIPKDSPAGRRELERVMEAQRQGKEGGRYKAIRRGWYLGEKAFKQELLAQMKERMGKEHYGLERAETAEAQAEATIAEEMRRHRWQGDELEQRPKGDAVKVALAARLRRETVMTVRWIAKRLQMGSPGYVNHLLYCRRKGNRNGSLYYNIKN